MKRLITILQLFCSTILFAQNWSPILVNEKMNYQHSDSSYISHTIWVDSAQYLYNDSIYYLNLIVKDVPDNPEIALRNQPQFLLKQMRKYSGGNYIFQFPGEMVIKSLAGIADPWYFDNANNIMAGVSSISVEEIFGVQDSVKLITLSDFSEIWLSKTFGIIKFPDFENGGYFELVGIQDTDYGESVPGFWEIFDFEVGDVFQYSEYLCNFEGSGYITRKLTITSKQIDSSSFSYLFDGIYYCLYFEIGGGGGISSYTYSGNLNYPYSLNHPANYAPGQIYVLPDSWSGQGTNRVLTFAKIIADSENGIINKHLGIKDESFIPYDADVFYELNENSDTIFRFYSVSLFGAPYGLKGVGYGSSIGEIYKSMGGGEYGEEKELVGYIKNGDTVGTITPDSLLLTNIYDHKTITKNWLFYPNPVKERLNINVKNSIVQIPYDLELRNLQGQLVKEEKDIQFSNYTMNIADLKPCVYLYVIKEKGVVVQQGKIIKK